tara:strand:+ start:501 stop:2435 length:1935 start_codon:yes stop_codon:yes gene_type:complete
MAQNLVLNILAKDKTRQAFAGVRSGLANLRSAVFSVQSALVGIGGGLVVKSILDVGSNVEQLRLRFAFLFKGVKEGDKAFKGLIDFASKVPFTLEEIQAGAGNLAVVTKNAEELNEVLKLTGNVASVTGLDFRTTAEQIQRSFSSGIGSADLFRERGVRALLGFQAGAVVTTEETKKRFRELFGEGGEFEKATEVLSTTFAGTLSMLSDKLFKFRLETGQAGFFDFIKQGLVEVNKLIESNSQILTEFGTKLSNALITATKQIIMGSAVIIQAISPIFSFVGKSLLGLFDFLRTLPEGVRTFGILGFLMLGGKGKALVVFLGGFIDEIRSMLGDLLMGFAEFNQKILEIRRTLRLVSEEDFVKILNQNNQLVGIATNLKKPVNEFRKEIEATNGGLDTTIGKLREFLNTLESKALISRQQIEEILSKLKSSTDEAKKLGIEFDKIAQGVLDQIKKDVESVNETIAKSMVGGIKSFSRGIAESIVLGKNLENTMKAIAQRILIDILTTTITFIIQQKILNKFKKDELNTNKKIESSLKRQIALQAILAMFGGGGGGGIPFFASGGSIRKGQPAIVGERGPELFIPNSSGQITQNARGTGGRAVNVNFNINTVDASGFEDLLFRSRGAISSLINQSLNEQGRGAVV